MLHQNSCYKDACSNKQLVDIAGTI